jgi:hypothetical protein
MNKKSFSTITGICFIAILAIFFIVNLLVPDRSFSAMENRLLQLRPHFSLSTYMEGRYETKLENYANDQFVGRNGFIKVKSATDVTEGKLEANGVYRCRDNYLMEKLNEPNRRYLSNTENALKQFRRSYMGVKMYFLLAPNAANILSDKLPATVRLNDQNRYLDAFFSNISSSGITPIDVRDTFVKNKDKVQLYYRTDHHWTTDGAYVAFKKSCRVMGLKDNIDYRSYVVKNDFKGTLYSKSGFTNGKDDAIKIYLPKNEKSGGYKNSVIYYADTKKKTTRFYQLDNLEKKDAYTVFGGSNHPMYTIQTPVKSGKNLLLVKDSYANSFIPFLAQHYRKIVVVDPRYFYDDINNIIKANGISQVLFLYNGNTFFQDDSLEMMLTN